MPPSDVSVFAHHNSNAMPLKQSRNQINETSYTTVTQLMLCGSVLFPLLGMFSCDLDASADSMLKCHAAHPIAISASFLCCDRFQHCHLVQVELCPAASLQIYSYDYHQIVSALCHSQVLDMPSDDLGAPAYCKFDVEAWMPGLHGALNTSLS